MDTEQAEKNLADRISEKMMPIHRGVIRIGSDQIVVFSNDGAIDGSMY
jgi:hypothetical protein